MFFLIDFSLLLYKFNEKIYGLIKIILVFKLAFALNLCCKAFDVIF
jgi:hypothetical protein